MINKIKKPRKMFDIPTFKARVNMLIALPGQTEDSRKMACEILENVLLSSGNYKGWELINQESEYMRKYL